MTATRKCYAGIGSRETPIKVLKLMYNIGYQLSKKKYRLRSGRAKGADTAFEDGVFAAKGNASLYTVDSHLPKWTQVFTDHFHPAPQHLKEYGRRLMCRNAMQILGEDGDEPVEFVVCWTKDGKATGGTGQAIRIAEFYRIPVFNLKNEGALEALKEFVNEGKTH